MRGDKTIVLKEKEPLVGMDRDQFGEKIKGTGGLAKATTDERQIHQWWKKWPDALIGALTGPGMDAFVVDFDIIDKKTGEIFELDERIGALEAVIGCALPETAMAMTASGGCHLYFALPDVPEGMVLGNSNKKLPFKIDVRGDGTGYVIVPPSRRTDMGDERDDGRYRWERRFSEYGAQPAPQELLDLLFVPAKGAKPAGDGAAPSRPSPAYSDDPGEQAIRKYGLAALDAECDLVRRAPSGARNNQLNESALKIAGLTVSTPFRALDPKLARMMLEAAARDNPGDDDDWQLIATIDSGWSAGEASPRDLAEIANKARSRAHYRSRGGSAGAGGRASASSSPPSGSAAASSLPPPPAETEEGGPPSQAGGNGDKGRELGCGPGADGGWGDDLTLACAMMPQTDLGNLERFLARYGANFLYVEAWGWLAWDGQRWNRDMAVPMIGRAVQETMRLMQDEADLVRYSGVPFPPKGGDIEPRDDDDDDRNRDRHPDDDDAERDPDFIADYRKKRRKLKSAMWYRQRLLARETGGDGPRHNAIVQVKSNGDIVLLSDKIAGWGRASEGAGHISCIAKMAEARLSARPEDFDADPLALNLPNGTLQFHRPENGKPARAVLRTHQRADRMTKMARAVYDPKAVCPLFDAFLERVQPNAEMRDFLDRWGGYNALGLADAQKMAVFYGEGQNGKGVWVQTLAWILGDYAWTTGIDTFMDAGRKRTGGGPTTDLAALAGRRMVYANEPDDHSKFSDGLVKSLTSDEPIGGVRELMKPPFELQVTFTNTIMANNLPKIGTDYGIRRRMQVVPWNVIIPKEERDEQLKLKIRAELSGVLNRAVAGALAYLTDGLPMPQEMVEATQQYHEENDLLMMFLDLCIARSPGDKLGATALHRLFEAWQTWAQQLPASGKAWSAKYLNAQMQRKGFKINKASTMQWHDIVPRFVETDFTDQDGKPVARELPAPKHPEKPSAGLPPGASPPPQSDPPPPAQGRYDDDDLPP